MKVMKKKLTEMICQLDSSNGVWKRKYCMSKKMEKLSPQHPEWFKKERERLPDFYQVITVEKNEATDRIISWMYNNLRGMFVVKRRGGVIQYFQTGFDLYTLPRWDLRELGRLDLLNPEERGIVRDFEGLIAKECNKGFPNHRPQRPRRRVSKTTIDPVTGKRKVTWVINPAKVVTRIKLPKEIPVALKDFKKWFYDSKTGDAVIRSNENVDIRILDPMDVFMFGLSDLTVLNASRINVGAGNANLEEAMLFQRAVERAWKLKREMLEMVDRIEKRKETEEKRRRRQGRKRSMNERKKGPLSQQLNPPQHHHLRPHPHMRPLWRINQSVKLLLLKRLRLHQSKLKHHPKRQRTKKISKSLKSQLQRIQRKQLKNEKTSMQRSREDIVGTFEIVHTCAGLVL
ncbi:hypothetical protein HanRHA438_Chr09g0385351 [Helianthus annuus]|nr:hypothetical protein HanRHA438_Chr09g0385351 [Helianthus annuus]